MKGPSSRLLALAFLAVGLAGCSSVTAIDSGMAVNIAGYHPADAGRPGDGGTITLRYINETVSALGFSRAEHKLYLDGTLVASPVNDTPFGILSVNEITRDLPVHFENPAYIRQLVGGGSSVVHYRLESRLYQRLGEHRNDVKLTTEGTLDLRGSPAAAAK